MIYEREILVRFALGDEARIMFFGNAFVLAHEVLEDFILSIGFAWDDYFARDDWGMPYRHTEASYAKPSQPGETLTARLDVERIGESSVVYRVRCRDAAGDETFAVRMVAVAVDVAAHTKRSVPAILRERLEPYVIDSPAESD